MNWEGWGRRCWRPHLWPLSRQTDKKFVETASGQSFFPNMKHARHPAQYDAWHQIKDYFNNAKSKCVSLPDSIATFDMDCRYTTYRMPGCQTQFEPRISWIQGINVTHLQMCCFWLSLLTEVNTSQLATVYLAMVRRSTGLSKFFGSVPMAVVLWISPWNLRPDNIEHTILGNILIYKPLFPLHFMHMFKLCIIFHVLQILFVNNKS